MNQIVTNWLCVALVSASLCLTACGDDDGGSSDPDAAVEINDLDLIKQVLEANADMAFAAYSDAVTTAQSLKTAIDALIANPSQDTLDDAREAWLVAREPYGVTEVLRFRASPIDDTDYNASNGEDGPEGDINAWPLGEGLIDYVVAGADFGDDQINVTAHDTGVAAPIPTNNIINSTSIEINAALLAKGLTADDERDVIAGYHAIEFLLWGQDLNNDGSAGGTRDNTPGNRPFTDFQATAACTSGPDSADAGICQRRGTYLTVAVDKLIADLIAVRDGWASSASYRTAFTDPADLTEGKARLLEIITGMGTLSEGELAGERMQIALSAASQEDEHSCFSDNTHRDVVLNAVGVLNSYRGDYPGYDSDLDGTVDATGNAVDGYGIDDYLAAVGLTDLAGDVNSALMATQTAYNAVDAAARAGTPVDLQIVDASSDDAKPMRDTIVALNAQAQQFVRIATDLAIGTADDVIDPDASECDTTDPTTEC